MSRKISLSLLVAFMLITTPVFGASIACTETSCLTNSGVIEKLAEKGNIYLIGPMTSGKTTIGRNIGQQLSMSFFDSDKEIETSTGMTIKEIFDFLGERKFREIEEKMIDDLTKRQGIVLGTGGGSILSETTRRRLSEHGVVVYLNISVDTQIIRLKNDVNRPLLGGDPAKLREVLENLAKQRNPLYAEIADLTICSDNLTVEETAKQVIDYLNKNKVQSQ